MTLGKPIVKKEKSEKSSLAEEEEVETMCDELTTAPIPYPPAPIGGRS